MRRNYEVMQRSLDLADTMQIGIEYIRSKFAEGRFEEMLPLLLDFTQAFISIQQAFPTGRETECLNGLVDRIERMQVGLTQLVSAYECADWGKAVTVLETQVVPEFTRWKEELERCYRPIVVV